MIRFPIDCPPDCPHFRWWDMSIDELLYDVEKAAVNKDRHEGSMRVMGEKAHNALDDWWSWIDGYLREDEQDD